MQQCTALMSWIAIGPDRKLRRPAFEWAALQDTEPGGAMAYYQAEALLRCMVLGSAASFNADPKARIPLEVLNSTTALTAPWHAPLEASPLYLPGTLSKLYPTSTSTQPLPPVSLSL